MTIQFKYFLEPEKYACILVGEHECDICHQMGKCFNGSVYYGRKKYRAFCFECVAKGRLLEVGASAVNPDFGALKQQIQRANPNASTNEIEKQAREVTGHLEGGTPKFPAWQDRLWPAHCGDYCQFTKLVNHPRTKGRPFAVQD